MILSYSVEQQIRLLAIVFQILVIPGLVWLLLFKKDRWDVPEKIADSIAISISLMTIIAMLFFFSGWYFSGTLILVLFILLDGLTIFFLIKKRSISWKNLAWVAGTALVVMLVIAFRFYQAKDLVFPAWVDSVHHVLITKKILEAGGIPLTLAPELDVPLYYHYGFHVVAALFSGISKLEPTQAVLWLGQVINALVVLGIYRLGKSIFKKVAPSLVAALLVGFAFQMPAYYVTWGRYTLLTGLLVMLPAMACAFELVMDGFTRERAARLVILTAGLALVHYLSLYYFGFFLFSLLVVKGVNWYRSKDAEVRKQILNRIVKLVLAIIAGILIALPWLYRLLATHSSQISIQVVLPKEGNLNSYQYILYLLGPTHNYYMMGGAVLGIIIAWWYKRLRSLALWSLLMVLLSSPWGLRFGPFRPDHMAIVLFIPASLLLSFTWVKLTDWIQRWTRPWIGKTIFVLGVAVILGWGAWQTKSVVNSVTVLANQADWNALDWIDENTPLDARFLTNTTIWQFQTYRGVDGGYWIIPETGRFALALPGLYGYGNAEEKEDWVNWMERASVVHACDDGLWSLGRW